MAGLRNSPQGLQRVAGKIVTRRIDRIFCNFFVCNTYKEDIVMKCTISTPGQHVVLTLTVDLSVNTPNLSRTDLLLDRVVPSPISLLILDLGSLSCVNSIGVWTIFQIVFKAREQAKGVYLFNMQSAVRPLFKEAGILEMGTEITTTSELGHVLTGNDRPSGSGVNAAHRMSSPEGRFAPAGISSV